MGLIKLSKDHVIPIINRDEWQALEPKMFNEWYLLEFPISHIRFTYEDLLTKFNTREHIKAIQDCQKYHMDVDGIEDIKYNFLISAEGMVYECRGWFDEPVKPAKYADLKYKCLDIVYIGDYSKEDPPWAALRAGMLLVMYALKKRMLHPSFRIIPLRDPLE